MFVRLVLIAFVAAAFASSGCEKRPAPGPAPKTPASEAKVRVYTVRGRVISLPDAQLKRGLVVHHEKIQTFYNVRGENTGMNEMEMEFPWLGTGVSTDGLAVGDAVELAFSVDWDSERMYEVTVLKKLPAESSLNLHAKPKNGQ